MLTLNENKTGLYLNQLARNMALPATMEFIQDCGPELPYCLILLSDKYTEANKRKENERLSILHSAVQLLLIFSDLDSDIMEDLRNLDYILLTAMNHTGHKGSGIFNGNSEAFRRYLPGYFYEALNDAINGDFSSIDPNASAAEWERTDESARLRLTINSTEEQQ